jgi:hypothetical protein
MTQRGISAENNDERMSVGGGDWRAGRCHWMLLIAVKDSPFFLRSFQGESPMI